MRNSSTNSAISRKFIITAHPVCYAFPFQTLGEDWGASTQINVNRNGSAGFTEPLYAQLTDDDIQISAEHSKELQAQGVDKFAESLQDTLNALTECDYGGVVTQILADEIARCHAFAERLRNPVIKSCLCDSCNDWMRGGCSSTCNAYQKSTNNDSTDYSYQGKFPSMKSAGVRDEHK